MKMCYVSKSNRNASKMHFIVYIQREKESRMTSRSRSENISLGQHALTSKPRLMPRLGLCLSMSPSTDNSDLELEVILDSHNTIRSMTRQNVRHFPTASGRMTPINVCLWHFLRLKRVNCIEFSNEKWNALSAKCPPSTMINCLCTMWRVKSYYM